MTLVIFMRGVNVGSAKRFQPSLLARELDHLGVSNLGAAGTFIVRGTVGEAAVRAEFLRRLPFACELMICKGRDLLKLAAAEPFHDWPSHPDVRYYLSVLARRPRKPPALPWSFPPGEQWQVRLVGISGRFVLCVWRRLGPSLVEPNGIIEKALGVSATTRNWNTIIRVCDVLQREEP